MALATGLPTHARAEEGGSDHYVPGAAASFIDAIPGRPGLAVGIGPVVSYATKIRGRDLVAEVKWLPELEVNKRLKGDYVWFKLAVLF